MNKEITKLNHPIHIKLANNNVTTKRQVEKSLGAVLGIPNRHTLEQFETNLLINLFFRDARRSNLRDLLSLGSCSIDTFRIVLDFIKRFALLMVNMAHHDLNFKSYNQDCFEIKDPEDGIKNFMIRGLDGDCRSSYLMQLGMKFQAQLIECFSTKNFSEYCDAYKVIKTTIKPLSTILRTRQANALIDGILLYLYDVVSDENCSKDKKFCVLEILVQLAENGCLDGKNQIIIEIVYQVQDLMSSKKWTVLNSIRLIANLAESGLLQGIDPKLIEAILVNAADLLNHFSIEALLVNEPDLLNHSFQENVARVVIINALCELAGAGLLKNVEPKAIEDILNTAIALLNRTKRGNELALMICKFIELGILEGIELMVIKVILFNLKNRANKEEAIEKIFNSIFKQAESGLVKAKPDVIEDILIQASELQDHPRGRSIMGLVSCILLSNKTGLINELSPNVIDIWSANLKKLLDCKEDKYVNSYFRN